MSDGERLARESLMHVTEVAAGSSTAGSLLGASTSNTAYGSCGRFGIFTFCRARAKKKMRGNFQNENQNYTLSTPALKPVASNAFPG